MRMVAGSPTDYGSDWPSISAAIRRQAGGICQRCKEAKAQHAHHLLPVRYFERVEDAHFDGNLIAVCHPCHVEEHRRLAEALPLLDLLTGQRAEKRPDALNINMGLDRLKALDAYWHRHAFPNRTAAIHALLDYALAADPPKLPDASAPPAPD